MQISTITRNDAGYPKNLKNIYDPPATLYVKGTLLPCDEAAVALVGTRRATHYGMQTGERLAYDLALRGITIVSGMAAGIDTAAHRGALRAKGRTIAVLGSGHGNVYPRRNKALYDEITVNGAVVTEFSHMTEPFRWNFPQRNRIISGLSLGVVVVEAPKRSGALITADFALEQGREVFALPGKVSSLMSEGTHRLIKQGAKLIEGADDVIEELEIQLKNYVKKEDKAAHATPFLSGDEEKIVSLLSDEPRHIDAITAGCALPPQTVLGSLTQLAIKRVVKELPGKNFIATVRR